MMKWLKNLFYRPPKGFEVATKNAINRARESRRTPETNPLIASCGNEVMDIIVDDSQRKTVTKIYFTNGTVLIIDSIVGTRYGSPFVETKVNLNKYYLGRGKYTKQEYKEVSL